MSIQQTNKSTRNPVIDTYTRSSRRGGDSEKGTNSAGASNHNQGTLVDRLDAIDTRYSYNPSLLQMFNKMDENAIRA